jgi:hypothetical protein
MNGSAAIALAAELAPLAELRDWPPVAERVESVLDGLRGSGSLSESDVATLRRWSRRWRRVSAPLREFYSTRAPIDERAERALLWVLCSASGPAPGPLRGAVKSAWLDSGRRETSIELLPKIRD